MSTEEAQTNSAEEIINSRKVQTDNGSSFVHVDHIEGADVWITEHVVDEPAGRTAPYTVRCAWRVHKVNQNRWIVSISEEKRMFNGCANGRREPTHEAHKNKLESELQNHYLKNSNSRTTDRLSIEFDA